MSKKLTSLFIVLISVLFASTTVAQNFPVTEWNATTHQKPLVFYISGDGGINNFSSDLCESLKDKGYDVSALNAKSYFYDKKTPEETANELNDYLSKKIKGRSNQQIAIIGYSFGADVLPFILNRLPKNIHDKIIVSFLMASSGSTDFEIHWADMLGGNKKRSMDVVTEINKLIDDNVVIISGSDDGNLELNKITLKKYTHEVLPGGHHFDGDTEEIVRVILNHIE